MKKQSPDALIAPWLSDRAPRSLWVVGEDVPPVVADYALANAVSLTHLSGPLAFDLHQPIPEAALVADPIRLEGDIERLGALRNRLIGDILCLVAAEVQNDMLYALGFRRGEICHTQHGELLSFHYALATYNHTRAWNNPKFWANPENWNKYWW